MHFTKWVLKQCFRKFLLQWCEQSKQCPSQPKGDGTWKCILGSHYVQSKIVGCDCLVSNNNDQMELRVLTLCCMQCMGAGWIKWKNHC